METYKKSKGNAGLGGLKFQINLLMVFFLNALRHLSDWKISTENEDASKFDDVVLELCDKSLILLQAKHKEHRKITQDQLLSTNSKRDEFSLPKYFFAYEQSKRKFKVKYVIVCTNTDIERKGLEEVLISNDIDSESILHYENGSSQFFTCNENLLPRLKSNAETYYEANLQGKGIDKAVITEENLKEFITKFQFVSNFPSDRKMDSVIEQLLSHLPTSKLWFRVSPQEIYGKIEDWFRLRHGEYLTEHRAKVMFGEIRSEQYHEELKAYKVTFDCNPFNFLDPKKIFHIITEKGHLFQTLKVQYSLQSYCGKALYANPNDGCEGLERAIEAFGISRHVFLIIICPYSDEEWITEHAIKRLEEILVKYKSKKLIFISESDNTFADYFASSSVDFSAIRGCGGLQDLSQRSRDEIIKMKKIIFQGDIVSLEELLKINSAVEYANAANEEVLEKLLRNETIEVGFPPKRLDEDTTRYYINRTFRKAFKREVDAQLEQDCSRDYSKQYFSSNPKHEFDEKKSRETRDQILSEESIYGKSDKVVLIADSAGMGKTTVLSKLAMNIKEKNPQLFVIRIELNDYTRFFKECIKGDTSDVTIEELLNSKESTSLTNCLDRFLFSANKRVVLMLDGIDEISPDYTKLIVSVLKHCLKASNFAKIFVTTRPHMAQELERVLKTVPYVLEPFTEQDQIDFLTSYWTHNLKLSDDQSKFRCTRYAKELLDKMSRVNVDNDVDNHFATIPLQVRMLAEIFQENAPGRESWKGCKEYLMAEKAESKLPEIIEITKLYDMFVEKKMHIFVDKGNPSGNAAATHSLTFQFQEYFSYHECLAVEVILNEQECHLFSCYKKNDPNVEVNLLKIGIVQKVEDKFNFVHRSFAEYFVSRSVLRELLLLNQNKDFLFIFIDKILRDDRLKVTRAFLDNFIRTIGDSLPSNILNNYRPLPSPNSLVGTFLIHQLASEGCVAILRLILGAINFKVVKGKEISFSDLLEAYIDERYRSKMLNVYRYFLPRAGGKISDIAGNTLQVLQWLTRYGGVNIKDEKDRTPLCLAIQHNHLEMVKCLLALGANVNNISKFRRSALHVAVSWSHTDIVKFFVEMRMDINAKDSRGSSAINLAACFSNVDIVKYLVDRGGDVNTKNNEKWTALHCAAWDGHLDLVKFLVQLNVNVNAMDREGWTPLHLAVRWNHLEIVDFLISKGADPECRTNNGLTVLHIAASEGYLDIIQYFVDLHVNVNEVDWNGNTPLCVAVRNKKLKAVKFLAEHGTNINMRNGDNTSALHIAATAGNFNCVELLLDLGAEINISGKDGCTPLHTAAFENYVDVVKLLVDRGAEVDISDSDGWTALHLAVLVSSWDVVQFLVDHEADPEIKEKHGLTAIEVDVNGELEDDVIFFLLEKEQSYNSIAMEISYETALIETSSDFSDDSNAFSCTKSDKGRCSCTTCFK